MVQKPTYEELEQQNKYLKIENDAISKYMREIEESEQLYRTTLENISDTVIITDDQGNIIHASPRTNFIFELSSGELYNLGTILKLMDETICNIAELKKKKEITNIERTIRCKSGQKRILLINVKSVNIKGGTVLYVMRDITERKQAEEDLRKKEERLRLSLAGSGVSFWEWFSESGRIYFDDNWARFLGYEPEELEFDYKWWKESIHPENKPKYLEVIKDYYEGRTPRIEAEYRIKTKSGDWKWIWTAGECVEWDKNKNPVRILGTHKDITERKQAENALRESEERFFKAFHSNPNPLVIHKLKDGRIIDVNEGFLRSLGYRREEVIGRTRKDITLWDNPNDRLKVINSLRQGKSIMLPEVKILTKSGKIRHMIYSADTIELGKESCVIAATNDITERKQAEETLRQSEEKLRMAIEGGRLGIFNINLITNKTILNHYLYEMLGLVPDGTAMTWEKFSSLIHPDDIDRIRRSIEKTIQHQKEGFEQFRIIRKDGGIRWLTLTYRLNFDSTGEPIRAAGVCQDITDQKHMEEELRKASGELEARVEERTVELEARAEQLARLSSKLTLTEQRERDRLASILHDHLQQLMAAAKIHQEFLIQDLDSTLKPDAIHVLDLIKKSIEASRSLSTELSMPILRSGDLSASFEWLCKWMHKNYGLEVKLISKGRIVLDLKDITVLLFQSIRELLFNVHKHAGVKSATLIMEKENKELRIVVSDQGVGFNPETVEITTDYGQKFGLFSIRERLMFLGGRFIIISEPNSGTIVSLVVPLIENGSMKKDLMDLSVETPEKYPSEPAGTKTLEDKIHVMLADDRQAMREGLSRVLGSHSDIEVVCEASNGEEAVHLARKIIPDVILMDINMPKINGVEATRIIHSEFPHIRIIAFSIYEKHEKAAEMMAAGASAYRCKSDNIDLLLAEIRRK